MATALSKFPFYVFLKGGNICYLLNCVDIFLHFAKRTKYFLGKNWDPGTIELKWASAENSSRIVKVGLHSSFLPVAWRAPLFSGGRGLLYIQYSTTRMPASHINHRRDLAKVQKLMGGGECANLIN